jgi:hypothetical protein
MRRTIVFLVAPLVAASACASSSEKIDAVYVPDSQYAGATCEDLQRDIARIRTQVIALGARQDQGAQRDRDAMMMSAFLFWPAIFLVRGDPNRAELARAKGEFDALVRVHVSKGCASPADPFDSKFTYIPPPLPPAGNGPRFGR